MAIILWAHRQRLSCIQTHQPPAAAVPCCRGTAASHPQSTRRGQSPSARLRRTWPTLTKDHLPNRLPSQRLSVSPCFFAAPMGFPVPAGGHGRQKAKSARQRQPKSLHSFAPPSSTLKHMRPTQSNARQKTTTLRLSGSFGYGQQGTQRNGSAATAVYIFSGMPLPPCLAPQCALLPVPKALRPPLHLSKRYAASVGQPPRLRDSVRPLCVKMPQLPPVGRVSADGAARIGQSSDIKRPFSRFGCIAAA